MYHACAFLLIHLATAAQAQLAPPLPPDHARIECFYSLTYRLDSTAAATRTETMRLQLGSKWSRFESLNALRGDSILMAAITAGQAQAKAAGSMPTLDMGAMSMNTVYRSGFRGQTIFKTPTTKQVQVADLIGTVHYAYTEPSPPAWAIGTATATIAGYACQQATANWGGRTWQAWFTREVPVADGPYKFYGLPGLIVKVGDTRQHYVYELVALRRPPSPVAMKLPDSAAKPIAKDQFVTSKAAYARNALEQMMASGNIRFNTPEEEAQAKQKARERAKRPTNPVELK
jgi:GLPGLI family protein